MNSFFYALVLHNICNVTPKILISDDHIMQTAIEQGTKKALRHARLMRSLVALVYCEASRYNMCAA